MRVQSRIDSPVRTPTGRIGRQGSPNRGRIPTPEPAKRGFYERIRIAVFVLACAVVWCSTSLALHSGLTDARGETVFPKEFRRDYSAANAVASTGESVEQLLALLPRYTGPAEQAELHLTIGVVYNQRTGVVDPAKAVVYLTNALKYELPEDTRQQALVWRGGSYEQLGKHEQALRDYLRVLLACSYYDLSGGWPEIKNPNVAFLIRSDDPENDERARDYREYRKQIRMQRSLLWSRFTMVQAVLRVQQRSATTDQRVKEILEELSPHTDRHRAVAMWLKSENKNPVP